MNDFLDDLKELVAKHKAITGYDLGEMIDAMFEVLQDLRDEVEDGDTSMPA